MLKAGSFLLFCLMADVGIHTTFGFIGDGPVDNRGPFLDFIRRERGATSFIFRQNSIEVCLAETLGISLDVTKRFTGLVEMWSDFLG